MGVLVARLVGRPRRAFVSRPAFEHIAAPREWVCVERDRGASRACRRRVVGRERLPEKPWVAVASRKVL